MGDFMVFIKDNLVVSVSVLVGTIGIFIYVIRLYKCGFFRARMHIYHALVCGCDVANRVLAGCCMRAQTSCNGLNTPYPLGPY